MQATSFQSSNTPEPHVLRRKKLLEKYPELKKFMGFDRTTQVIILGIVIAQYTVAWSVQNYDWLQAWYIFIPLCYLVGGTLSHWAAMGVHECSHNLAARTKTGNRITALVANLAVVTPGSMSFFRHHMGHHTNLGIEKLDNDLPSKWEVNIVKKNGLLKFLWLLFYIFFSVFARNFFQKLDRWEIINIVVIILALAGLYAFIGGWAIGYLALSTFFGFSLIHPAAAHFIHEHYLWNDEQETYSYYGPLNYVNFFVGYHVEHHDIMNIPGRRLKKVKETAPEFYEKLESSKNWAKVLIDFVMRTDLGHHKRIVRDKSRDRSFSPLNTSETLFSPLKG